MIAPYWSRLCAVDVDKITEWIDQIVFWNDRTFDFWIVQGQPSKPQRILLDRTPSWLVRDVAAALGENIATESAMLSRMHPGQSHGYHVDDQPHAHWLTRVHVPLVTNPGAWLMFEGDRSVHACKVCGNWPEDEEGFIEHGKGCYTQDENGGGSSYVDDDGAVGIKVHFEPGWAYTFNTLERHAFGNDGKTDRVHLIFDVVRDAADYRRIQLALNNAEVAK